MQSSGGGFIVINYSATHEGTPSPVTEPIFTEDSLAITTEDLDEIVTE